MILSGGTAYLLRVGAVEPVAPTLAKLAVRDYADILDSETGNVAWDAARRDFALWFYIHPMRDTDFGALVTALRFAAHRPEMTVEIRDESIVIGADMAVRSAVQRATSALADGARAAVTSNPAFQAGRALGGAADDDDGGGISTGIVIALVAVAVGVLLWYFREPLLGLAKAGAKAAAA